MWNGTYSIKKDYCKLVFKTFSTSQTNQNYTSVCFTYLYACFCQHLPFSEAAHIFLPKKCRYVVRGLDDDWCFRYIWQPPKKKLAYKNLLISFPFTDKTNRRERWNCICANQESILWNKRLSKRSWCCVTFKIMLYFVLTNCEVNLKSEIKGNFRLLLSNFCFIGLAPVLF